jgi:hypothetical protein
LLLAKRKYLSFFRLHLDIFHERTK